VGAALSEPHLLPAVATGGDAVQADYVQVQMGDSHLMSDLAGFIDVAKVRHVVFFCHGTRDRRVLML